MLRIGSNIDLAEKISEGGTANVFFGVNSWTGAPVAVKELKSNFFESQFVRDKFKAEANKYLYLQHTNIVSLVDFIDDGSSLYLVMEYVDGLDLNRYQNEVTGPMPVSMAAILICETLKAIAYAHSKGIIHLDIKPSNIMLSNNEEIKVIDFGISHDADEKQSDKIIGTPSYMSPEQVKRGGQVDFRTDIYALGVTLYELITGRPPYDSCSSREELFESIKKGPFPKVSGQSEVCSIISKATSISKGDRYQDCDEFYNDLIQLV
jgi:serine/threonine protein kinase